MYEEGDVDALIRDLGERFEHQQISFKRYPSCACAHVATDAALSLAQIYDLAPEAIAGVEVSLSPYMNRLVGAPFDPDENPQVAAQFSVRYGVACALLYRRFGLAELEEAVIFDPRVRTLTEKIDIVVDEANEGVMTPATVTLRGQDGETYRETIRHVRGSPENPLSDDELIAKFKVCVRTGPRPLGDKPYGALIERIRSLEDVADMATLFDDIL